MDFITIKVSSWGTSQTLDRSPRIQEHYIEVKHWNELYEDGVLWGFTNKKGAQITWYCKEFKCEIPAYKCTTKPEEEGKI